MTEEAGKNKFGVGILLGGKCKLCNKMCGNLVTHKKNKHSEREKECPFCGVEVNPLKSTVHIHEAHPIQIGIFPLSKHQQPGTIARSGDQLKTQMTQYGMVTEDAIAYKYFSISFNHQLHCYRWVTYSVTKRLLDSGKDEKRPQAIYKYCESVGGSQVNSFTISELPTRCSHGHGAPARLYRGDADAFRESCLFPNIAAQKIGFNNGLMSASEWHERELANFNEIIIVITGPTYDKDGVGKEDAGCGYVHLIPNGFYKIYIIKNGGKPDQYQSFWLPHRTDASQLFWYRESIPKIQKLLDYPLTPLLHNVSYTWERPEKTRFCRICKIPMLEQAYVEHQRNHSLAFTCLHNACYETFETKEEYDAHKEEYHRDERFKCNHPNHPECTYVGFRESELKVHLETHEEKKYQCEECPLSFKHQKDLRLHGNQAHAKLKNYYCPISNCPTGFAAKNHLENHIVCCHSTVKQFCCTADGCMSRFGTRILLRAHLTKVHSLDKEEVDAASRDQTLKNAVDNVLIENLIDPLQLLQISNEKREVAKLEAGMGRLSL